MYDFEKIEQELFFRTSRSSGSGGQNVNKVETRVELWFDVHQSNCLTQDQKALLLQNLSTRITKEGKLHLVTSKERSQLANKKAVVEKFHFLLDRALQVDEYRIPTKPTYSSKLRRKTEKELHSKTKKNRSNKWSNDD